LYIKHKTAGYYRTGRPNYTAWYPSSETAEEWKIRVCGMMISDVNWQNRTCLASFVASLVIWSRSSP